MALFVKPGLSVLIEENAGIASHFKNSDYEAAGAKIVSGEELYVNLEINEAVFVVYVNDFGNN